MIDGVLAHDIDDWHMRSARIVQIGEAIGEAGTKMKQSARWFLRHPRVAIRGPGDNAFEKTQHAADLLYAVESADDMHFRSAWIREAGVNSSGNQRAN
jgi:hypothetical protein